MAAQRMNRCFKEGKLGEKNKLFWNWTWDFSELKGSQQPIGFLKLEILRTRGFKDQPICSITLVSFI